MVHFDIVCKSVLSIFVHGDILLGEMTNFNRSKKHLECSFSANRVFFEKLIISIWINYPVCMEVLNAAHNDFNIFEKNTLLAIRISSNTPPDVCYQKLLLLGQVRSYKTKLKKQLRHLSTRYCCSKLFIS